MTKRRPGEPGKGWSKGICIPDSRKKAISIANSGSKNGMWKGENIGLSELHLWIRRHVLQPKLCEVCNNRPSYDLANVTGIYSRDFNNWKYLCRKCHMLSDGRMANLELGRVRTR